jgi:hypothetical protein
MFVHDIFIKLAVTAITSAIRYGMKRGIPTPKWFYYAELRENLKRMPFIYRDLELEVLQDFAEIELTRLVTETFLPKGKATFNVESTFDRLRTSRKILLVGQPGIGKTTLFRYCILSIVSRPPGRFAFSSSERIVPCYVPLKTIKGSDDAPIVQYLLKYNSYFSGSGGLKKLTRLARSRRLMLFLDGYDEIPIATGTERIRQEIEILFARRASKWGSAADREIRHFYESFEGCRVWLSTRREFFLANPIPIPSDASLFWSHGLAGQRAKLVGHIFQKYEAHSPEFYRDKLDPERFLQQLTEAAEGSILELSYNPLFLTIMCFVYVGELRDGRNAADIPRHGAFALIERCIDLLLFDIDEAKVRGLTSVQRDALLHRRAAYIPEKRAFLEYLAAESYFGQEFLFSEASLRDHAKHFFSTISSSLRCEDILRGLESDDATANLVIQIVYSGVLVGVDLRDGMSLYDFPHRRFKEVLACDLLNNSAGLARLRASVSQSHMAELIIFYSEQTEFGPQILSAVIEAMKSGDADQRLGALLADCLSRIVSIRDRRTAMRELVEQLMVSHRSRKLSKRFIEFWPTEPSDIQELRDMLYKAYQTRDASLFRLLALPFTEVAHSEARTVFEHFAEGGTQFDEFTTTWLAHITDFYPGLVGKVLLAVWPDREFKKVSETGLSLLYESVIARASTGVKAEVKSIVCEHFRLEEQFDVDSIYSKRATQLGEPSVGLATESRFEWVVEPQRLVAKDDDRASLAIAQKFSYGRSIVDKV